MCSLYLVTIYMSSIANTIGRAYVIIQREKTGIYLNLLQVWPSTSIDRGRVWKLRDHWERAHKRRSCDIHYTMSVKLFGCLVCQAPHHMYVGNLALSHRRGARLLPYGLSIYLSIYVYSTACTTGHLPIRPKPNNVTYSRVLPRIHFHSHFLSFWKLFCCSGGYKRTWQSWDNKTRTRGASRLCHKLYTLNSVISTSIMSHTLSYPETLGSRCSQFKSHSLSHFSPLYHEICH